MDIDKKIETQPMEMGNKRMPYLDYARVFVAYLVCFGHLESYDIVFPRMFIYAFHMPFFFLVSGMLHKYNGGVQWAKYIKTLLIPIAFFCTLCLILYPIFFHSGIYDFYTYYSGVDMPETISGMYILHIKTSIRKVLHSITMPCGPMWFVVVLFYCKIFTDIWEKHKILPALTWLAIFIVCTAKHHAYYLMLPQAAMAIPFYMFGFKYKDRIYSLVHRPYAYLYAIICLCLFAAITLFNGKATMMITRFGSNHDLWLSIPTFYANALLGSFMMLFLSTSFKSSKHITNMAGALISILGFQSIFLGLVRNTIGWDQPLYITAILSLLCMYLCFFLHKLIMRYCPYLLGKF